MSMYVSVSTMARRLEQPHRHCRLVNQSQPTAVLLLALNPLGMSWWIGPTCRWLRLSRLFQPPSRRLLHPIVVPVQPVVSNGDGW